MNKAHAPIPGGEPKKKLVESKDVMLLFGAALIVAGTAWLSIASAVIVFGFVLSALAFISE